MNRLCDVIAAGSAEAVCAQVMAAMIGSDPAPDDVAVLAISRAEAD
ncbi:hypothetical protein ACFQX7_38670 [Luedemannella flava]